MLELASPKDREAVERLARQVHRMHVHWRPDLYEMPPELYPEDRFQAAIDQRQLYVAKAGGEVAGYAAVMIRDQEGIGRVRRRVMLLEEICVDECLRCQGFGSRIVADIRALARAFGCTDLQLGVFPQNDVAVSFYQKMGFYISSISMQMKLK